MKGRFSVVVAFVGVLALAAPTDAGAQEWTPKRLADGQPDIQGMWNNADANHTPLELPDELSGRDSFTQEELRELAQARYDATLKANEGGKRVTPLLRDPRQTPARWRATGGDTHSVDTPPEIESAHG